MPREENVRVNILSKLVGTKPGGNNKSLIRETLKTSSVAKMVSILTIEESSSWITLIMQYLHDRTLPHDSIDVKKMAKEASYYTIIGGQLYRRSLSQPLLKYLSPAQVSFVLEEVHKSSCGHHLEGKALALKVLWAGYYWPTMTTDAVDFVRKCSKCQQHAHFHIASAKELSAIMSPWPFSK